MARDGAGTYNRTQSDYTYNTVIDQSQVNSELNDIATELTNSIDKDGQTTWTGNQNTGSNKLTSMAVGNANTDSVSLGQVQNSGHHLIGSVSGVDTITGLLAPAITAYASGQSFFFVSAGANTGAVTMNLNSVGAKAITKEGATALVAGDIPSGALVHIVYDGTRFQLISIGGQITASSTNTLTNKSISLTNNTVTGTLAELNTAISDATLSDEVLTTQGDILYRNGSANARLGAGTSGYFLKTQGAGANPAWAEVDALPTQTSHSGKYLTTDGSSASWTTVSTSGNTTTEGLYEHAHTISANYVITTNNNALTAGPITINSGISVTVPSGSTWVIA